MPLKITIKDPFEKGKAFSSAIVKIHQILLNFFDSSGQIFLAIYKNEAARTNKSQALKIINLPIGETTEFKVIGGSEEKVLTLIKFEEIYGKTEAEIESFLVKFKFG